MCGDELPATFLRVAHVKPRSLCSDEEKRDPTNVLVACVWCDVAFERGWLGLDEDQKILVSEGLIVTPAMSSLLSRVRDRQIARALNAESVAFHRQHSFVS